MAWDLHRAPHAEWGANYRVRWTLPSPTVTMDWTMGLKIHSLQELPPEATRDYYVYLLDYGWEEPLGRALRDNFDQMADAASRHGAAVIIGLGNEFNDHVLSWHGINGRSADNLLPALLVTNKHPATFRDARASGAEWDRDDDRLVLIPLRDHCKTPTDVAGLIAQVFEAIKAKRPLREFEVATEERAGVRGAVLDAVVLRPTIAGVGFDLMAFFRRFRKPRS